ncbi:chemotaxis protein CheW, partial [Treponema pallidum]
MVGDLGHGLGTMIEHMEAEIGIRESFDGGVREPLAVIDFKMVTFSLAGKDYAVDIMQVKEIAKAGSFTYVPNTSPFVLGVYNLRGDIIPIIDLRRFFNIPAPRKSRQAIENMVIVTVEDQTFGVVVDGIDKVIGVSKTTIQPPHPIFGDINIKYIRGVVEEAGKLYILLDVHRIFSFRLGEEERTAVVDRGVVP